MEHEQDAGEKPPEPLQWVECRERLAAQGPRPPCRGRRRDAHHAGLSSEKQGLERANAIKTFLVKYGVPRKEIKVYSKGEEDAAGEDEATWASDRKGVFK